MDSSLFDTRVSRTEHTNSWQLSQDMGVQSSLESPMSQSKAEAGIKNHTTNKRHDRIVNLAIVVLCTLGVIAIAAILGSVFVLTGQAILRPAALDGYNVPYQGSLQVGATGAVLISPVVAWVYFLIDACWPRVSQDEGTPFGNVVCAGGFKRLVGLCQATALGAAAGGIGAAVLRLHGYDVMDPLHAARAGALGGAVLGPAIQVGTIVGALVFLAILKALPCEVSCWNDRTVETWN